MNNKKSFQELETNIVSKNICAGCGACFLVCPYPGIIGYQKNKPFLTGECKKCGICLRVCPRYKILLSELEEFVFGRTKSSKEIFGIYKKILVSRSTDEEILKKCQDGGVATTLLTSALDTDIIDSAVVSGIEPPKSWRPKPLLVTKRKDIISNAGTRYSYSSGLLAIKEGLLKKQKLLKTAFVGTPCQIWALRRIQKVPIKKYANRIAFSIGLFCSESFSYEGLMIEQIQKNLDIDLNEIDKLNIKGGFNVHFKNGSVKKIPLKKLKQYRELKCLYCEDFSAELADVSVGGIGLNGWTITVLRTDKGLNVFKKAVEHGLLEIKSINDFKLSLTLLEKLSKLKRKKAKAIPVTI